MSFSCFLSLIFRYFPNVLFYASEMSMAARLRQVLEKVIAAAAAFFSRTLKNCMNLIEFQCLQMKHPETE